jgi:hypothetical protein
LTFKENIPKNSGNYRKNLGNYRKKNRKIPKIFRLSKKSLNYRKYAGKHPKIAEIIQ